MKCAVSTQAPTNTNSEYNQVLQSMGQSGGNGIEVAPKGCTPISTDVCKSGFMAPSENITRPENALATCCKCREGETCDYCLDKENCTGAEKEIYVTNNDCFSQTIATTTVPEPSPGPLPGPSPEIIKKEESFNLMKFKWYIVAFIVLLIIIFIIRRNLKPQSS
jgi:hypothetical protein